MKCQHCEIELIGRSDKRYCSEICRQRYLGKRPRFPYSRKCKWCQTEFVVSNSSDANRKYCSNSCAVKSYKKHTLKWKDDHPGVMKEYNRNRLIKNPGAFVQKHRSERKMILDILGGKCVVCGVENKNWLHVDYIPTTRGKTFRHPRHFAFVSKNAKDFRILCANHHYELTLTGKIEGTKIICRSSRR